MRSFAVVIIEHARGRQQHEREVLGRLEVLARRYDDRQQQREHGGGQHDDAEEDREAVDAHHAARWW